MTTPPDENSEIKCPVQGLLKLLAGKWKPEIFRLASSSTLRFNSLLRQLSGANKQTLAVALKELEESGILQRNIIKLKPLHIEYTLTDKGRAMIPVFEQLESLV